MEPVNTTLRTLDGGRTLPDDVARARQHLEQPGGRPAATASPPSRIALSGDASAGLSTTAFPAASAGAKPQPAIGIGKFHGAITATTPAARGR